MIQKYLKELKLTKPSQTEALINLFRPLLQDDSSSNIKSLLNKKYKIAVVANMSAGKSTFINAMFADDVLPAYSEATTDCPIYIYSDDNPNNDHAIIEFSDNKMSVVLDRKTVIQELKLYAKKDSDKMDAKYRSVKKIDLYWDFHSLQNNTDSHLEFVIIDTPGPNNTDEFKNKHSSSTKDIIMNEADMVIYLFDYEQIDSNLEASNGNIWDLVKIRKEKDKSFEAFFVINKIDMAFEDNEGIPKIKNSKNEDEFYNNLKEYWLYHENKAIDKIKIAAEKYGFLNPKIFTTSAEYQKLYKMKDIPFQNKKKMDTLKELFKNVFHEKWEQEFLKYLKISWIEDSTRLHIENIEQDILKNTYNDLELLLIDSKYQKTKDKTMSIPDWMKKK